MFSRVRGHSHLELNISKSSACKKDQNLGKTKNKYTGRPNVKMFMHDFWKYYQRSFISFKNIFDKAIIKMYWNFFQISENSASGYLFYSFLKLFKTSVLLLSMYYFTFNQYKCQCLVTVLKWIFINISQVVIKSIWY